MFDNDTKLLSEAYEKMLGEKALTPEQIAKNAQPAGTAGTKGEELPKNKECDKETEKTLENPPYTDQDPENFDQDGVDTKVKDRYVVKEETVPVEQPVAEKVPVKQAFTRTDEQQAKFDEALYHFAMGITGDLQAFEQEIRTIGGEMITPALIREASQTLTRIIDDFRRGRNPFGSHNPTETPDESDVGHDGSVAEPPKKPNGW
jgi:hypothetical protein